MMRGDAEAMILGGGLAGSMVALELARAGRGVILLERSKAAHHKVCGEFLSGEAIHYLERHGIDLPILGGVALHSVRLAFKEKIVESRLPFAAFSLTRRLLDEELLRLAASRGVEVQRDSHVERLEEDAGLWHAHLRDGRIVRSAHAFLATGKHDLRSLPRPEGTHAGLVAFKQYYRLTPQQHAELGDAVELILFPGGYAGLQPVEEGGANLCLLIAKRRLQQIGGGWDGVQQHLRAHAPHLQRRLDGATALLDAPLAASHIPYGHLQRNTQDGLWRVGDQAAVIPSFCGDGMAIALHSGALAARQFLDGGSPASYLVQLRGQIGWRIALATRLSQLLVALPQAAQMTRMAPTLLSSIATWTRIPASALIADDLPDA